MMDQKMIADKIKQLATINFLYPIGDPPEEFQRRLRRIEEKIDRIDVYSEKEDLEALALEVVLLIRDRLNTMLDHFNQYVSDAENQILVIKAALQKLPITLDALHNASSDQSLIQRVMGSKKNLLDQLFNKKKDLDQIFEKVTAVGTLYLEARKEQDKFASASPKKEKVKKKKKFTAISDADQPQEEKSEEKDEVVAKEIKELQEKLDNKRREYSILSENISSKVLSTSPLDEHPDIKPFVKIQKNHQASFKTILKEYEREKENNPDIFKAATWDKVKLQAQLEIEEKAVSELMKLQQIVEEPHAAKMKEFAHILDEHNRAYSQIREEIVKAQKFLQDSEKGGYFQVGEDEEHKEDSTLYLLSQLHLDSYSKNIEKVALKVSIAPVGRILDTHNRALAAIMQESKKRVLDKNRTFQSELSKLSTYITQWKNKEEGVPDNSHKADMVLEINKLEKVAQSLSIEEENIQNPVNLSEKYKEMAEIKQRISALERYQNEVRKNIEERKNSSTVQTVKTLIKSVREEIARISQEEGQEDPRLSILKPMAEALDDNLKEHLFKLDKNLKLDPENHLVRDSLDIIKENLGEGKLKKLSDEVIHPLVRFLRFILTPIKLLFDLQNKPVYSAGFFSTETEAKIALASEKAYRSLNDIEAILAGADLEAKDKQQLKDL